MSAGNAAIGQLLRELAPQVLGAVVRRIGHFAEAEDAVQESLLAAALQWADQGLPEHPRAWLIQVALRRHTDQVRSDIARRQREEHLVLMTPPEDTQIDEPRHDDTVPLLFLCCHPALTAASAIALTLRAVGGLTTAEIASAFFVPEATMAQRISRAKQKIADSGIPFEMPSDDARDARLAAVLHVLYLVFNEGYTSSAGDALQRVDLAGEAIRLTRVLRIMLPRDAEVAGLLALMLLIDARRDARSDEEGRLVPLARQDRARWDRQAIAEGVTLLDAVFSRGHVGLYQLQAAINALHDEAPSHDETDWPQILALYGVLERVSDNPMVRLNRAVALAMVQGAQAGLAALESIAGAPSLRDHHRLDAVRAHLHDMAGDKASAIAYFRAAAGKTNSLPERDYLRSQAHRLAQAD